MQKNLRKSLGVGTICVTALLTAAPLPAYSENNLFDQILQTLGDNKNTTGPDVVVTRAFQDVYDRDPSAEELRKYRSHIIDDGWTEKEMRDELRARRDDDYSTSSSKNRKTREQTEAPEVVVRRAYQDVLGRDPDPSGMRIYRSRIIDDGWTERQIREDLRKSAEFKGKDSDTIIYRAYQDVLGRDPDATGLAIYRKHIIKDGWSEKQIRDDLRNSQEYRNRRR